MTKCIIWQGCSVNGYGYSWDSETKKVYRVHRQAYINRYGQIPTGLVIDHLCRNKLCYNTDHLEAVTQKENVRRGLSGIKNATKTHCKKGHQYSRENTYLQKSKSGIGRVCRICKTERKRKWNLEHRNVR